MEMNKTIKNQKAKELWDSWSDNWFKESANTKIISRIIEKPSIAFPKEIYEMLTDALGSFEGKKILVPSSGDNTAVFAFHLLGAKVTSTDISPNQIDNAKQIAVSNDWDIRFMCQDSMLLEDIEDGKFDLVYTSNGVHVWISNLSTIYNSFYRVLNDNGYLVFFDTHPATRSLLLEDGKFRVRKKYSDIQMSEDAIEYLWNTEDYVNALSNSNFRIKEMKAIFTQRGDLETFNYIYDSGKEEQEDSFKKYDWKNNPWAALPQCLAVSCRK